MSADDHQQFHPDSDSSPELDMQFTPGNRPASGARRATPGEVLSQGFHGAQNAGDFLGLDTEFTASLDPSQVPQGQGQGLGMVAPPSTMSEAEEAAQALYPTDHRQAHSYASSSSEGASAFEYGQDLGDEHEDYGDGFELESAPVGSKRPVFMALAVAALGFASVFFGSDLLSLLEGGQPSPVAVTPRPQGEPGSSSSANSSATPTAVESAGEVTSVAETTIVAQPADPAPAGDQVAQLEPSVKAPGQPRSGSSTPRVPGPSPKAAQPDPGQGDQAPDAELPRRPALAAGTFPTLSGTEYTWASEELLELIWRGESIPMDAIKAPAKTLMPRVGDVRVFTTTGDLFDGRLYAVGQNRVWIDTEPGRVGLDGDHVERIEVMMASAPTGGGEHAVPGRRVAARVPGGRLFGNVLKTEEGEVLLQLDDGGKVRVKATDLEDLGSGRAVVVGR